MAIKPIIGGSFYQDGSLKPIVAGMTRAGGAFRPILSGFYVGNGTTPDPLAGRTVAVLGDSISQQNGSAGTADDPVAAPSDVSAKGYLTWALERIAGRSLFVYNGGVGGETTAQMFARVGAVIAKAPKLCVVHGGANDFAGSVPSATTIANLIAICNALIAGGVRPILTATLPNDTYTANQPTINAALSAYATGAGVAYCDWHTVTADVDGTWLAGLSADGVHPNAVGASVMGEALALALDPLVADWDSLEDQSGDVLPNGDFSGTAGNIGTSSGVIADDWVSRMGANATMSKVARVDGVPGSWQQIVIANPGNLAGDIYSQFSITAGDVMVVEVEYEFDSIVGIEDFSIELNTGSDRRAGAGRVSGVPMGAGAYELPASGVLRSAPTLMPSTESCYCFIRMFMTSGTVRLGRAAVRVVA